jgi:RNA polymerase sigma factor (sigma-70 family)
VDAIGCRAHQRFGGRGLLLKRQARFAGRRAG